MTASCTFGFEAEYAEAAEELALSMATATTRDFPLIGTRGLHQYHCECYEACNLYRDRDTGDGPTYFLRAQRDSSCSGELISKIFNTIEDAVPVLDAMESHAILVDAIPGFDAGFHVHVGTQNLGSEGLINAFFEYLRFEPLLTWLASGRWTMLREMNQPVRSMIRHHLADEVQMPYDDYGNDFPRNLDRLLSYYDAATISRKKHHLFTYHQENDRHSFLSIRTRFGTWEFRIFNSSRSAWRMRLWIELARAFTDEQFITLLSQITRLGTTQRDVTAFIEALRDSGNTDAAALATKQDAYLRSRGNSTPEQFTALAMVNNRILA